MKIWYNIGMYNNDLDKVRMAITIATIVGLCALAAALAALAVSLCKPAHPPAKEPAIVQTGIPPELVLPEEDVAAWKTVSGMHGEIGGTTLAFSSGMAEANGVRYKVAMDFCRDGTATYVRVRGNGDWVAKVAPSGAILKAYRAPKNGKPLKDIFGRR